MCRPISTSRLLQEALPLTSVEREAAIPWEIHRDDHVFPERKRQMNIAQGLAHAVNVAGNRPAISCGETEYTWSQFAYRTDCLARGLAHLSVQHGDRVALLMLNCHRYLELYYACARMGAAIVTLNTRL